MPKRRSHPVFEHFRFDESSNVSICLICHKSKAGQHAGNLIAHMRIHTNESKVLNEEIEQWKTKTDDSTPAKKNLIKVDITFEQLKSSCVELCTKNGRPFKLLEDSGFKKIVDPILRGLQVPHTMNASNIAIAIDKFANQYREQIKLEMKNKMLSIKLDIATKMNRSMLGVNVQYIYQSKLCLRTLAVKEMKFSHTSFYIRDLVLEIFRDYDLSPLQMFACTSDNGANVVKLPELFSETQEEVWGEMSQELDDERAGNFFKADSVLLF